MKQFFHGVVAALGGVVLLLALGGFVVIETGFVPINADVAPSRLENDLLPVAVRASVARRSSELSGTFAPTQEDLLGGAEIYKSLCAQCHGRLNGRQSVLGASFYPPAPQLPGRGTSYSETEVRWIVKHGIRNTSMPAWSRMLSDDDIRRVAAFIVRMDSVGDHSETEDQP